MLQNYISRFAKSRAIRGFAARLAGLTAVALVVLVGAPVRADQTIGEALTAEADYCANTGLCNHRNVPAPPPKPDVWGALAVSPSTLLSGDSWNYNSEATASNRALAECRASSRAGDCKVVVTVADVCVALASSKATNIYAVGGPTGAANFAENNALLKCQRAGGGACAITASFCADGIHHVLGGQTVSSNGNPIFVPAQTNAPPGRR